MEKRPKIVVGGEELPDALATAVRESVAYTLKHEIKPAPSDWDATEVRTLAAAYHVLLGGAQSLLIERAERGLGHPVQVSGSRDARDWVTIAAGGKSTGGD